MSASSQLVPTAARIVAAILGVLALAYGIMGYVSPTAMVKGIDASIAANQTLSMMFGCRNAAIGIALLLVAKGGVPESFALIFIIRFLVELQDAVISLVTGAGVASIIPNLVLLPIEGFVVLTMIKIIAKRDKAEKPA